MADEENAIEAPVWNESMQSQCIIQGNIFRREQSGWSPRWCCIYRGGYLYYFASQKNKVKPMGVVYLLEALIGPAEGSTEDRFGFRITSRQSYSYARDAAFRQRTYSFELPSEQGRNVWMEEIQALVTKLNEKERRKSILRSTSLTAQEPSRPGGLFPMPDPNSEQETGFSESWPRAKPHKGVRVDGHGSGHTTGRRGSNPTNSNLLQSDDRDVNLSVPLNEAELLITLQHFIKHMSNKKSKYYTASGLSQVQSTCRQLGVGAKRLIGHVQSTLAQLIDDDVKKSLQDDAGQFSAAVAKMLRGAAPLKTVIAQRNPNETLVADFRSCLDEMKRQIEMLSANHAACVHFDAAVSGISMKASDLRVIFLDILARLRAQLTIIIQHSGDANTLSATNAVNAVVKTYEIARDFTMVMANVLPSCTSVECQTHHRDLVNAISDLLSSAQSMDAFASRVAIYNILTCVSILCFAVSSDTHAGAAWLKRAKGSPSKYTQVTKPKPIADKPQESQEPLGQPSSSYARLSRDFKTNTLPKLPSTGYATLSESQTFQPPTHGAMESMYATLVTNSGTSGREDPDNPDDDIVEDTSIADLSLDVIEESLETVQVLHRRYKFIELLDEGMFGAVYRAVDRETGEVVAAKFLKQDPDNEPQNLKRDFLTEASILHRIGRHSNVIQLLGVSSKKEPYMMICNFAQYGNLKGLLTSCKERGINLTTGEQRNIILQIVDGMVAISSSGVIHRDLACRNVLVCTGFQMKISDVGLARAVQNYYIMATGGLLPFRIMAPESLNFYRFTSKSDVWSFGCLIWEMCTYGGIVLYEGIQTAELSGYIGEGKRLPRPNECSDQIHSIMAQCWMQFPIDRPSFQEMARGLRMLKFKGDPSVRDIGILINENKTVNISPVK